MDTIFAFIEESALSEWIRGSDSLLAFPTIITLHALGLGFLAGGGTAIDLRLLGFAPAIPLKALARFLPVVWLAFAVNAVSGTLLLIAYPTKAFTNPLFYVKLGLIALALFLVHRIGTILRIGEVEGRPLAGGAKPLAVLSLITWVSLILAGRFLAYTHRWELLGVPAIL
ncbi:MAG TPA: hypothetical protein VKW08_13630 [Xanthobacteraceae bacterium]|nr:hypothetical protein [Xanthobacteraceae bacterium]